MATNPVDRREGIEDIRSRMETHRLRQLCAIVESGGMREAARLLHVSHSGLSKSIKALEHELGVSLFLPSGRGLVLTDAGRRVYARAGRALAYVEEIEREARGERARVPIRIATFEVFSTYFVGALVERALAGRPVFVREAVPGAIEEALAKEEVDIGLTYLPVPRAELEYLRVTSLEMAIYGRRDRFAEVPTAELPFASPTIPVAGTAAISRSLDGWPDEKVPRDVVYAVDMLETGLDLARRGLAVVYIPTFIAALHNETVHRRYALEPLPLPKVLANPKERRRPISLVKRRSTEEEEVMKRIAQLLREICGRDG